MRVIIAGSRHLQMPNHEITKLVQLLPKKPTMILSGNAKGIDRCGELWADENGIPVDYFPPDYTRYGTKRAPHIRNTMMANHADALILIWDGKSLGSASMKEKAEARELIIIEAILDETP